MEAEDLLDKFAQEEGFGNWNTVVLNCHHSVIISVAIAAVNQALRQPPVIGSVCRITKAQAESIYQVKEDMKSMLGNGEGEPDRIWKRHIRNMEKFLNNNGLKAN